MIPWLCDKYGTQKISYILFSISQVIFPLSFLYANNNKMSPVETSLLRGIASILLNFFIARYYNMTLDFKYDVNFTNLIKRNGLLVFHGFAITTAQFYLPLPIVHTVSFFAPIFIFVIDYFENGIRINKTQFFCLFAGVIGILCTINSELVSKILDKNYQLKTTFENYITLDPQQFSLYGLALIGVMFAWAYGLLRVRAFYKNTHVHVNFHLGLLFLISSCFLYPIKANRSLDFRTIFIGFFLTGVPLALGQLFMCASLGLNKKTGQLVILTGIPVFIGYLVSYFSYGQSINAMQLTGSCLILVGLLGVINCSDRN